MSKLATEIEPYFYVNGEYIKRSKAKISIENTGLNRAFGVFDLFMSRNGKPTFLNDYLARFSNSQKFLGLSREIDSDEIVQSIGQLQKTNGFEYSTFKLLLLGDGEDGAPVFDPLFSIINLPFDPSSQPTAISVITHPYVREHSEIKSLNYFTSFSLQKKKTQFNASEVVFYDKTSVSEASRSNIFILNDETLVTPKANILHGITRKNLLKCVEGFIPIEIRDISFDELLQADEVFLTSSTKEVMPVVRIDDHTVGDGSPGKQTLGIQKRFKEYIQDHLLSL